MSVSPSAKRTALAIQIPAAGVSVPCRATPAPRLRAQWNGDQRKGKAGNRKRKAAVQFHAGFAPTRAAIIQKLANRALGIVELARLGNCQAAELDGPVAPAECRDGVVIRVFAREFVRR